MAIFQLRYLFRKRLIEVPQPDSISALVTNSFKLLDFIYRSCLEVGFIQLQIIIYLYFHSQKGRTVRFTLGVMFQS